MSEFSKTDVMTHLDKILASNDFAGGPRLKKFLTHLVTEELAGRGNSLKGTPLAMDVFGRGADFDPNNDPIVRIEAVKLRKALEHYYLTGGKLDELIISVPKGQYRPKFTEGTREEPSSYVPKAFSLPALAIATFEGTDTPASQLLRQGLPEELALELNRFDQIRVVTGWNGSGVSASQDIDYVLNGTVLAVAEQTRLNLQLVDAKNNELIWSDRYNISPASDDIFQIQEDIARQCASQLLDAYGAVEENLKARFSGRSSAEASVYEALLAFHKHLRVDTRQSLAEFIDYAQSAVSQNPHSGLANALKALVSIEKVGMSQDAAPDELKTGRDAAMRAIDLAPNCQEALFAAAFFSQLDEDRAKFSGFIERALLANPNGHLMIAYAASWVCAHGDPEQGTAMMLRAKEGNPFLPDWTNITLALADILTDNFTDASDKVLRVDGRGNPGNWTIIAAAHTLAERPELARKALDKIAVLGADAQQLFTEFPLAPPTRAKLAAALPAD